MARIYAVSSSLMDILFKGGEAIGSSPGGTMLNSSVSLARAGAEVSFISELGDDMVGQMILQFLDENGVHTAFITRYSGAKTPIAIAAMDDRNEATYQFYKAYPKRRALAKPPQFNSLDMLLYGSFFSVSEETRAVILPYLQQAKAAESLLYYDPNMRSAHKLTPLEWEALRENIALADVVRGSHEDFELLWGLSDPSEVYRKVVDLGADYLIYSRATDVIMVFTPKGVFFQSTDRIEVVSSIGAGDSFNAGVCNMMQKLRVSRSSLNTLEEREWQQILTQGRLFANETCKRQQNFISKSFGNLHR